MKLKFSKSQTNNQKGLILPLVLVFSFIFVILLAGLVRVIIIQLKSINQEVAYFQSLEIAEAGIHYYGWHLTYDPDDYQDGTGEEGPYQHQYSDPEGEVIGQFLLEVTPPSACGPAIIQSTGWTEKYPEIKRTIRVKYAKETLAKYSFLTNENVWFKKNEELKGPIHSNGGIRMDAEQNSLSTSAKATYTCEIIHDYDIPCDLPTEKPGIWGDGEGGENGLWKFPVPIIHFGGITQDLSLLKEISQSSETYFASTTSEYHGYYIKFKNNGSFDVYKVKELQPPVRGYNGEGWIEESNDILVLDEDSFQNYKLSSDCAPIFVEDDVWVDGEIKGRTTLVAARFPDLSETNAKIIINGDIDYIDSDSVLGLIAQKDILIPFYAPDKLMIKAVMLAQKGHVFRYHYPDSIRNKIETYGSIISNKFWAFTWLDSKGKVISGYTKTEIMYDFSLTYNPPPYFPTHEEYKFIGWEELIEKATTTEENGEEQQQL